MNSNQKTFEILNPKSKIVLVHGAFRGGWSWQKVRRILQQNGHEVFAPSLKGAGEKTHLLSSEITLLTWVNDIANLLIYEDLNDVILVGHSQGGIIIQAVAEVVTERISNLVFIDSPVLQDNQSAMDILPLNILEKFGLPIPNSLIEPTFLQSNEHFTTEEIDWFNQRLTAVPTNPSLEKIRINNSNKISHNYIFCSKTPTFYPCAYTKQRFDVEGIKYNLIDAPHDCIWTHSDLITELILKISIKI